MSLSSLAALVLALLVAACEDDVRAGAPDAGGPDAPAAIDAPPPRPDARLACYASPVGLECPSPAPAPTDPVEVDAFLVDRALPLRCGDGEGPPLWDLAAAHELFVQGRIFMVGEVHGTNEIGLLSRRLFESLAVAGEVDVVAMELPMDFQEAFATYVEQGSDWLAEELLAYFAPNFFGTLLPEQARALVAQGLPMRIALVDSPYGTAVPLARIEALAAQLASTSGLVLDTMPPPKDAFDGWTADEIAAAIAYHDHLVANLDEICVELDAAGCDELYAMARAVWVAAAMWQGEQDGTWFARREEVIYFNLRDHLRSDDDRMFLHMGAFHTNLHGESAGSRMEREHAPTMGRCFSVAPAFGDGSEISYGGELMQLPAEPAVVARALEASADGPHLVPTVLPGANCVSNPLADRPEGYSGAGGTMGETYDAYLHIRLLTPETRPGDATVEAKPSRGKRFLERYDRVHALERARAR